LQSAPRAKTIVFALGCGVPVTRMDRGSSGPQIVGVFARGESMRAAIYARVSTADQQTLPLQIQRMEEYAASRSWTITHQVEEQASGAKDTRPKRAEVLKAARRREIDVVVVWKLDRWGRSMADLATTLNELRELGVGFVIG